MTDHAGWRSRASSARLGYGRGYGPARPATPVVASASPVAFAPRLEAGQTFDPPVHGPPWQGVKWSLVFVGFLVYVWVIITFSVNIGYAAIVAALLGLVVQDESPRLPKMLLLFGAFLLWGVVGYFQTEYPWIVYDQLVALGKLWLIMLVAVNAIRSRAQIRFFIFFFLGAFALYPMRGALFNYFGGYTVWGRAIWNYIFENPNDLAALSLLPLSMVLALFVREPRGWPKLAALAGVVMLPVLILMTQSRGGVLAMGVFAIVVVAGQRGRRGRALIATLAVVAAGAVAAPEGVWERMSGLVNATDTQNLRAVDREGSADQRFELWKVGMTIARENPVVGVGFGAYSQAHGVTSMRGEFRRIARGNRDTHSTYLNVLAETGVIGLILFSSIFITVTVQSERVRRRIRGVMPATAQQIFYLQLGLLAYFTAGVFGSFAKLSFPYLHAALLFALASVAAQEYAQLMSGAQRPQNRAA